MTGTEPQSGSPGCKDRIRNSFKCTEQAIINSNTSFNEEEGPYLSDLAVATPHQDLST